MRKKFLAMLGRLCPLQNAGFIANILLLMDFGYPIETIKENCWILQTQVKWASSLAIFYN